MTCLTFQPRSCTWLMLTLLCMVLVQARPPGSRRRYRTPDLTAGASEHLDLIPAASGHHHGRVQIKVYRGPDEHGHHEHFAPHGYWVKQPADEDHHHK